MCTGRVDLAFVLRAFARGADGVFIGGCWPGECHYVTEGNYDALGNVYLGRKLLGHMGLYPERLTIEWIGASEGNRFAEAVSDFARRLRERGPLGRGEGRSESALASRLAAARRLVPYLKLVEREKLRPPERSEEAYREYYAREETERLFRELVADRLTEGQIVALLGERTSSATEIAARLQLGGAEVASQLKRCSRQGLIRYDVATRAYALA
jgi:coenzyme F420-reducing hydrogenase delta subunit